MRFKPPPPDAPEIGWRVEFRPTEVQLTDFENAAYCCFLVLLTRVIISYKLNFLMKISLVGENMKRAQYRDAVLHGKFHFPSKLVNHTPRSEQDQQKLINGQCCSDETVEMTINEIINGDGKDFPGLVPLIRNFLDGSDVDVDTRCTISQYLSFIQKRASGEIWTLAHWMRKFVSSHSEYKKDSYVNDLIVYEMLKCMDGISKGLKHCPNLLGTFRSKTEEKVPRSLVRAEEHLLINQGKWKS